MLIEIYGVLTSEALDRTYTQLMSKPTSHELSSVQMRGRAKDLATFLAWDIAVS